MDATPLTDIRILVVDDHTLFRRGLTALLSAQPGFQVVADAADAGEAQRRAIGIGGSLADCAPATPPGMRGRTGRFEELRS